MPRCRQLCSTCGSTYLDAQEARGWVAVCLMQVESVGVLKLHIWKGIQTYWQFDFGWFVLWHSSSSHRCFGFLLWNGQDETGYTALFYATREGHLDVVQVLLEAKVKGGWCWDTMFPKKDHAKSLFLRKGRDFKHGLVVGLVAFENILRCFLYFPSVSSDSFVSCTNTNKQAIMYDHLCILSLIEFLAPQKSKNQKTCHFFCEKKKATSPARPPPTCRPRVRVPRRCYWLPQRRPTPRCCYSCWRHVLRCRPGDTSKSWPKTKRFGALAKDTFWKKNHVTNKTKIGEETKKGEARISYNTQRSKVVSEEMEGRVKELLKGCFLLFGVGSGCSLGVHQGACWSKRCRNQKLPDVAPWCTKRRRLGRERWVVWGGCPAWVMLWFRKS